MKAFNFKNYKIFCKRYDLKECHYKSLVLFKEVLKMYEKCISSEKR